MVTKTLAVILLACAFLVSGIPAVPLGSTDQVPKDVDVRLHQECLYPVVQLLEIGKKLGSSGFVVRSQHLSGNTYYNLFLTCAHSVSDELKQEVVVYDYEDWSYIRKKTHYPCVFYGVDHDFDVAVGYFLSDKRVPTVKLDIESKLYIGSDVFKIGCGAGQDPRLDFGKVTLPVRKEELSEKYIRHSATTCFGDSGGPLFYQHKVVGIINRLHHSRNIPIWTFAYAVPVSRLPHWSKANDGIYDHIVNNQVKMPRMPQYRLELVNSYEIQD